MPACAESPLDLEAELAKLGAQVTDPRGGVFGPDSMVWEVNRHSVIFLGAGRAALLQLAHPWVAQAIHDHSGMRGDPIGRFHRTFRRVFALVYGDLGTALEAARRVHGVHATIAGNLDHDAAGWARGTAYRANDEDALRWVHATLLDTSVYVYERVVRPLTTTEKEAYYEESRRFAALFGIGCGSLPADWTGFRAYTEHMWHSDELSVTPLAASIARFLLRPPHPALAPVSAWYRKLTAALLPLRIRAEFGLDTGGSIKRRLVASSVELIRRSHPLWPRALRYVPAYHAAQRRLAGIDGVDRLGALLDRALGGGGAG